MLAALLALAGAAFAYPLNSTFSLGVHVPGTVPLNPKEPLQQRTAYVNATAMHVSWNTYGELNGSEATVVYGTDPYKLNKTAWASSNTYATSRTFNHHALLTDLEPHTVYWYRVAYTNCFNCAQSETYRFTTVRTAGDFSPYSVALVGDMGTMGPRGLSDTEGTVTGIDPKEVLHPGQSNTIQSLAQSIDTFDTVIHAGDLAYADYFIKQAINGYWGPNATTPTVEEVEEGYETTLEQFYDELHQLTAMRPYMVAPGNHDSNCDNGGTKDKVHNITYTEDYCVEGQRNFTGYRAHWRMPGHVSEANENFWYSYDDGMVHYVFFNTETDFGGNLTGPDTTPASAGGLASGPFGTQNEQMKFLHSDLASVDRSKTPWVVAVGHRPWYVSSGNCTVCQEAFEDVFVQYKVDVVMQGHVHAYERMHPVAKGIVDPNGLNNPSAPLYIVNGAGGHYDGLDTLDKPLYYSAAQIDSAYGWSRLHFLNRTHMTHQFVAAANTTVLDEVTLYKKH